MTGTVIDVGFYAGPASKSDLFELGEDGVIVIETLTDFAVAEAFGVAGGTAFLAAQVFEGAFDEGAVARGRGDDVR